MLEPAKVVRRLDVIVSAVLRLLDRRELSEQRQRAVVLPVTMEDLSGFVRCPVGQRPEGVDRVQGRRAAQVGLRQIQDLGLRRELDEARARPEVDVIVAGVVAVGRDLVEGGDLSSRRMRDVSQQDRLGA